MNIENIGGKNTRGDYHGKTMFIPRITLPPTEGTADFSFQLKSLIPGVSDALVHYEQNRG